MKQPSPSACLQWYGPCWKGPLAPASLSPSSQKLHLGLGHLLVEFHPEPVQGSQSPGYFPAAHLVRFAGETKIVTPLPFLPLLLGLGGMITSMCRKTKRSGDVVKELPNGEVPAKMQKIITTVISM